MLRKRHCSNCYYDDDCDCLEVCKDYTSLAEDVSDEEIDDIIENNRVAFRADWFEYIEYCNN